mmetsp:Transcript_69612/g.167030  ORF Transcript_69612/g.167030 Transcript_69612/m.167030 type:complete len:104 (-) Transcript_69612:2441-2752(-)
MPALDCSSSWLPLSITLPLCMTAICVALITVESRCAIRTTVHPVCSMSFSNAFCTKASFSASRAEVASSKNRSLGCRKKHLAIASRWRCPPDIMTPLSPQRVS